MESTGVLQNSRSTRALSIDRLRKLEETIQIVRRIITSIAMFSAPLASEEPAREMMLCSRSMANGATDQI
ncbi:hypothetical protein D3C81_2155310 [compost metagenome]